jgi:cellulose synthase/poly-beta-1,6-N-acetylglucosamine synthase-like glycosyltransferase
VTLFPLVFQLIAAVLAIWWIVQFVQVRRYDAAFRSSRPIEIADDRLPKMAVLTPLRGSDALLPEALRCILSQDYPDYEVTIMVDRRDDPAWDVAVAAIDECRRRQSRFDSGEGADGNRGPSRIHLTTLHHRRRTCSLVCSTILQFLDEIDGSREVVAFSGADDTPPPGWLRELGGALADPGVGTTLGNRWYLPTEGRWGSLVRHLYNAGAAVPMWMFGMPWGGAVALRVSDFRRSGLYERLQTGMVEDTPMKEALEGLGLSLKLVPQLISVVRSETTLARCYYFMRRQIYWTRLYHPQWSMVVLNGLFGTLSMASPLLLVPWAIARGDAWSIAAATTSLAYLAGLMVLWFSVNRSVCRVLSARGEAIPPLTIGRIVRTALAMPLAQAFYMTAVVDCLWRDQIEWSGVRYEVKGPYDVRLVSDPAETPESVLGSESGAPH